MQIVIADTSTASSYGYIDGDVAFLFISIHSSDRRRSLIHEILHFKFPNLSEIYITLLTNSMCLESLHELSISSETR